MIQLQPVSDQQTILLKILTHREFLEHFQQHVETFHIGRDVRERVDEGLSNTCLGGHVDDVCDVVVLDHHSEENLVADVLMFDCQTQLS